MVYFSGLILIQNQFPGLVLCPSCKNVYSAMRREGSARVEGARGKDMVGLDFSFSALGNVYETVALSLQEFILFCSF